jgi:Na+/H+ antiporter NhaD/arsenite permease-like protein
LSITSVITAVVSAFLDNVTTVVLLTPITFFVAQRLGTSPVPFLISQVLASNIGGTATLIGDPPNIIIGSQMGKDFNDVLVNLAPVAAARTRCVPLDGAVALQRMSFARPVSVARAGRHGASRDGRRKITNVPSHAALARSHGADDRWILVEPAHSAWRGATIALTGAVVLMIVAREDVHEIFNTVEWPTLFFFIGLFHPRGCSGEGRHHRGSGERRSVAAGGRNRSRGAHGLMDEWLHICDRRQHPVTPSRWFRTFRRSGRT